MRLFHIPGGGLEPPCLAALDFESSASTIPPSRRTAHTRAHFFKLPTLLDLFKIGPPWTTGTTFANHVAEVSVTLTEWSRDWRLKTEE